MRPGVFYEVHEAIYFKPGNECFHFPFSLSPTQKIKVKSTEKSCSAEEGYHKEERGMVTERLARKDELDAPIDANLKLAARASLGG